MTVGEILLLVPVIFSWGYDVAGTVCFRRWLREAPKKGTSSPPITVFRPLKAKIPDLASKLTDLCLSLETGDQLLIGIYGDDAEQHRLTTEILARHRQLDAQIILCERNCCPNPKINKLMQMAGAARHGHWVILDAEVENARAFLPVFRREWAALTFPVFSALYRFRRMNLDVVQVPDTLWPGLALMRKFSTIRLTLGACLAITSCQIEKLGGWEALGNCLAEDFQIGQRAAKVGERVTLSNHLAVLDNDLPGIKNWFLHQHRIAATYRVCQPAGFAGSLFTHGPSFALLFVVLQPSEIWRWLLLMLAVAFRIWGVLSRCHATAWKVPAAGTAARVLLGSFLQTGFWILAWLPLRICWAGCRWRIQRNGRMAD